MEFKLLRCYSLQYYLLSAMCFALSAWAIHPVMRLEQPKTTHTLLMFILAFGPLTLIPLIFSVFFLTAVFRWKMVITDTEIIVGASLRKRRVLIADIVSYSFKRLPYAGYWSLVFKKSNGRRFVVVGPITDYGVFKKWLRDNFKYED